MTISLKMCHRLQCPGTLIVEREFVRKPAEKRADLIGVKVFQVGLIVTLILGYPGSNAKRFFLAVHRNQQNAAYEKMLAVNSTNIGTALNPRAALRVRDTEPGIRPLQSYIG